MHTHTHLTHTPEIKTTAITLTAISQREYTTYYSFVVSHKDTIRQDILDFFQSNIRNNFPDPNCENYCLQLMNNTFLTAFSFSDVFDVCRVCEVSFEFKFKSVYN